MTEPDGTVWEVACPREEVPQEQDEVIEDGEDEDLDTTDDETAEELDDDGE